VKIEFTTMLVRSLSPPKPPDLDPQNVRRQTLNWRRNIFIEFFFEFFSWGGDMAILAPPTMAMFDCYI
jgi:hypothetical protein